MRERERDIETGRQREIETELEREIVRDRVREREMLEGRILYSVKVALAKRMPAKAIKASDKGGDEKWTVEMDCARGCVGFGFVSL